MPEAHLTSFPALSVYPPIGISRSASGTDDRFYFCNKLLVLRDTDESQHTGPTRASNTELNDL